MKEAYSYITIYVFNEPLFVDISQNEITLQLDNELIKFVFKGISPLRFSEILYFKSQQKLMRG